MVMNKIGLRQRKIAARSSLFLAFFLLFVSILTVFVAYGDSGSIWTTLNTCGASGSPQNVNEYYVGDNVYINGNNFAPGDYSWDITGTSGSCDPKKTVAFGTITVDGSGAFCFCAYHVHPDDCGVYKYGVGGENDNYHVVGVGCTLTDVQVSITGPDCDGWVTLNATPVGGMGPFTYQWFDNGTSALGTDNPLTIQLALGSHSITVKVTSTSEYDCWVESTSQAVTVYANPSVSVDPSSGELDCNTTSVLLTASVSDGESPFSYQWYKDGSAISGVTSSTYSATAAGDYTVKVTDNNGCSDTSATVTLTDIGCADLSLTKSVDNPAPNEGDTIAYTITLTNGGPSVATGVQVTDLLPAGLTYVSDNGGGAYDSGTGVWSVASLASGSSTSLAITATVDTGTAGSTITNTAEVTAAGQPDPDSTPNNHNPDEDDQSSVDITVQSADLAISKTVDNPTSAEGDTIVYTITFTNNGPSDATEVTLSDLLPVGVTYVSNDSGGAYDPFTGVWNVGDLAIGAMMTLNITATVDANTAGTTITNAAEVTTFDQPDPDTSNNRDTADITVQAGPAGGGGSVGQSCEGKVIINEVAWAGTAASSQDQWIELRNLGTIPVDLSGWTLQWRRKKPVTEAEKRWKTVDLSGVILPAEISACDLAKEPQTASVTLVKTDLDAVSWQVVTEQKKNKDESFYTLERLSDNTISNAKANLVYDTSKPHRLALSDLGDVIELLNADGEVVDTANAFDYPSDGWPAGDAQMQATMERTDPLGPDVADNWHTNLGIITYGEDVEKNPLIATADAPNSDVLDQLSLNPDVPPAKTRDGARLEVGLEVTQQERRAYGWPWVRVTQPELIASAGGGGMAAQGDGAGFKFSGRYTNGVYWLGIDTANLAPGRYNVWVVYGGGKTVLVPIEVLP